MPTYTQPGAVWISAGGEAVCHDHGGSYLTSEIAAGEGPHIFTPLDDWLYHSPETAAEHDLACEVCARQLPAETPRRNHADKPTDSEREQ